jgi:hypothetical protein
MDRGRNHLAHSLPVRIMHWIGATAVICMTLSGWQIYDASPLLPFTFPRWMTLGGWLAASAARRKVSQAVRGRSIALITASNTDSISGVLGAVGSAGYLHFC